MKKKEIPNSREKCNIYHLYVPGKKCWTAGVQREEHLLTGVVREVFPEEVTCKIKSKWEVGIKQRACPHFWGHPEIPNKWREHQCLLCFSLWAHCCTLLLPNGHSFPYSLFQIQKEPVRLLSAHTRPCPEAMLYLVHFNLEPPYLSQASCPQIWMWGKTSFR